MRSSLISRVEKTETDVMLAIHDSIKKRACGSADARQGTSPDDFHNSPIHSRSPAKKDLQLVQSSLENPLSSYMSSRRSFTVESPHFGQFREPGTPQSLCKQPFQQQIVDAGDRVAQQLMSIAADGCFLGEDSKFTFQGPQNDSNAKYDLKFDSFQQPPPVRKHNNIQIVNTFCRHPRELSLDEDTKRDDPMNQQSTSEPKSSDYCASRDDEVDLEQLVLSVSRNASKRLLATNSNLFSSESSSHQASTESNTHHSERMVLSHKDFSKLSKSGLSSSQVVSRPIPFNYTMKEHQNIFKDSASDLEQKSAEFGIIESRGLWLADTRGSPLSQVKYEEKLNQVPSERSTHRIKEKDSKLIDYEENLARGFKRKGLSPKGLKENEKPSSSLKLSLKKIDLTARDKSRNSCKKKSHDGLGDRLRPKMHIDVGCGKEVHVSRLTIAGESTPRNGSARKSKAISNIPLCLDMSGNARSPKQPTTSACGLASARSTTKLGLMKEQLASKMALIRSPTGDKSFNATVFIKNLHQQALKGSNKSQTPLSKKELKKFMEKRKFTSTVVADGNGSLTSRSAVKLKSKRKLISETTDRGKTSRERTPEHKPSKTKEGLFSDQHETFSNTIGVRESKESTGSYLGELLHERGTARSTLRASGELKMGENEKARLRQMGDRHLELSKCLTTRAKPSLEIPLENSFVRNRVDHHRKCENTPERIRTRHLELLQEAEKGRKQEQDWAKDASSKQESYIHRSGELTRKSGNLRIDISSLSSKVLATIPFDT
jgi:hypothetical protein